MAAGSLTSIGEKLSALELASGQDACERLLSIDGLPSEIDAQTRRRMAVLAPELTAVAPAARFWPIGIALPGGWSIHGASIARSSDGFHILAQSANFTRNRDQSRTIHDAQGIARSRNYWVELDFGLAVQTVRAVQELGMQRGDIAIPASGLLHGRPYVRHGEWWIVGAIGDAEAGQMSLPLLGRLDGVWLRNTTVPAWNAEPDPRWNPIISAPGDPLRCMASVFPTVVWRIGAEAKPAEIEIRHAAPLIARRLFCGTQLVPADGGYLCLAHESVAGDDGGLHAVHRWLWFDGDLSLSRLSRPFVLCQRGGERATGLTRRDGELIFSVARDTGEIWVGSVPEAQVLPLLAPPLQLDIESIERQLADDPEAQPAAVARSRRRPPPSLNGTMRPSIASMTITGSNREIIGAALRSVVDWVDVCVLIDTGIDDDTIAIARAIAGDKLIVRQFAWCDDFSAVRNFALSVAADTGASWAVFVDSDERMRLNGVDIHAVLAASPEVSLLVPHDSGSYTKDRFFRLPVTGAFQGPTHEAFYITLERGGGTVTIPGVVFEELSKSPERMRRKDERDSDILRRYTETTPHQPRWFFYLGDALSRLGEYEDAAAAFRACYALRGWDEESAWAMYRATQCLYELRRLEEALETVVAGMARHAGVGELYWFAAHISQDLGRPTQAVYWARHAIELGCFAGIGTSVTRVGWRYPFALWEGPYEVLRRALKDLGDDDGAAEAERLFAEAAAAREAQPGTG
jgi:hypothetical protein